MNDDRPPRSSRRLPAPLRWACDGIRQLVKDGLALNRRALAILVTVPVVLTLLEYFGLPWHYIRWFERDARISGDPPPRWIMLKETFESLLPQEQLHRYVWWGVACLLLLVLIPTFVSWLVGVSPRQLGVRLKGTGRDIWTYVLLYVVFLPVIWLVSQRGDFQQTYPFYKPGPDGLGVDFLIYQVIYCSQFFAIEYFFRGFIVLGLKPRIGAISVLVMLAPYCMIHYYKPFPEAMGAIGAGLVLGLLSFRTGTILYGWFLHYAVALSMDLLALYRTAQI